MWDAVEVVEFKRKHTAKVGGSLFEIRLILERLVQKRDERRDAFARSMRVAMETKVGNDAEETLEALGKRGLPTKLLKDAVETVARESGRFTVFAMVDALTRSTRALRFAGDRIEQDARIGALLSLAS